MKRKLAVWAAVVFCTSAFFALSGVAWAQVENPGGGGGVEQQPPGDGGGGNGGSGGNNGGSGGNGGGGGGGGANGGGVFLVFGSGISSVIGAGDLPSSSPALLASNARG